VSAIIATIASCLSPTAQANLITNPSFETVAAPVNPYKMVYISPTLNTAALTGWSVTGSVDVTTKAF